MNRIKEEFSTRMQGKGKLMFLFILSTLLILGKVQSQILVSDIKSDTASSNPNNLIEYNDLLIFTADDSVAGNELFAHNGDSTWMLLDINPGTNGSSPENMYIAGGKLFFTADDGTNGREVWSYDGLNIQMIGDINTGSLSSSAFNFLEWNGELLFIAKTAAEGNELHRYNLSSGVEELVSDYNPGGAHGFTVGYPIYSGIVATDSAVYMTGKNAMYGEEVCVYKGDTVKLLVDDDPGTANSDPVDLGIIAGTAYVFSNSVFKRIINDTLLPVAGGAEWGLNYIVIDDKAYSRSGPFTQNEPWVFDGDTFREIKQIYQGSSFFMSSWAQYFTKLGDEIVFSANDGIHGIEPWITDADTARFLMDIEAGAGGSNMAVYTEDQQIFEHKGELFFGASRTVPNEGYELWKTDGINTSLVMDINPGASDSDPENYVSYKGALYFTANDSVHGIELWRVGCVQSYTSQVVSSCALFTTPSGSHTWDSTGLYFDTLVSSSGCDSVVEYNLTINNRYTNQMITSCDDFISPSGKFAWNSTGIYFDTIPAASGCDSIIEFDLTINSASATISVIDQSLVSQNSGDTYQWLDCNDDNSSISGEMDSIFTPSLSGDYALVLEAQGCVDTSLCLNMTIGGFDDLDVGAVDFQIFPNPSQGQIQLNFTNPLIIENIQIYNSQGQLIYSQNSSYKSSSKSIFIEGSRGIYWVIATDLRGNQKTRSFIKN